jgi:hypothetical protein
MKRWYLLLALMALAACTQQSAPNNTTPFVGGTNGLLIDFIENAPPKEVADKGQFPFDIHVKLVNEGEHAVPTSDVLVTISGLFPPDFGKSISGMKNVRPLDNLEPVRKDPEGNTIPGGQSLVSFEGLSYGQTLDGNVKFPVRAEVCYKYQTKANGLYCMKDNLLGTAEGVCDVIGAKAIHNSGAPVHVTSFRQSVAGQNTILFTFTVSQKGNGNVYKPSTQCDTSSFINENRVKVTVNAGAGVSGLRCLGLFDRAGLPANEGYIQLTNGEATFTCTQPVQDVDAEKELSVILDYDYKDVKSTEIIVKHLPE